MAFKIELTPKAQSHVKALRKREQQILTDAIAVQLTDQPAQPTRNRKPLEENALAPWELRVGNFRVFYDVKPDEELVVVVAVGHKQHNVLYIGGEEFQL
jgi:mRNA-degrading endonuclease RelE of RelBE toxin-antitoxin system